MIIFLQRSCTGAVTPPGCAKAIAEDACQHRKLGASVLDSLRDENVITVAQEQEILDRISYTTDPATAFSDVQFIQENGPEKLGFVANRLAHALWREEIAIVNEGVCTLEECDAAYLFGPGLRTAIFGPGMVYELGSPAGLLGTISKFSTMSEMVFADLSNADKYPEGFGALVDAQIKDEIEHLPDFKGKTREEQAKWRDHMLIEFLKLHHKL